VCVKSEAMVTSESGFWSSGIGSMLIIVLLLTVEARELRLLDGGCAGVSGGGGNLGGGGAKYRKASSWKYAPDPIRRTTKLWFEIIDPENIRQGVRLHCCAQLVSLDSCIRGSFSFHCLFIG